MPKVSVIIPVFNCEAYIEECLRSVIGQSEGDLEIIVVDDGSTDGTLGLVKRVASRDARVSVYSRPHSGYPGVSRNFGLGCATGRYITLLDGDDLYHPDKIRRSLTAFEMFGNAHIVFHDYKPFLSELDEAGTFLQNTHFLERATGHFHRGRNNTYICHKDLYVFASIEFVPLHISSTMFRRGLLAQVPPWFREDMRNGEDGDFWLRLIRNRNVVFVDEVLSYYRQHPASTSSDLVKHLLGSIQLHSENLERGREVFSPEEVEKYKSKIAAQLLNLGYQYFRRFDTAQARSAYRRSMGTVFRAKSLAAYLKTFAPAPIVRAYRHAVECREARGGLDDLRLRSARHVDNPAA